MNNKVHYLSFASVIAAFAMVMLHTNGCFWEFSKERYWITANIVESVMYFAVPVFFMISGATLLDYRSRYTTKEYFLKRINKTLIPFIIWSVFGSLWQISNGDYAITYDFKGIKTACFDIINTSVVQIYWFFIPLFRIYLLIPLVSLIKESNRKKIFIPLSIVFFVLDYILCNIGTTQGIHRTEIDKMPLYLSYVLVGYLICKYEMSILWRTFLYVLGIIGLVVHAVGTHVLSFDVGYVAQTWKGYANIPCVLYSIAVFVLIKQIGQKMKHEKVISVMEFIGQYTFAIYLIHWYVMDYVVEIFLIDTHSIVYRLCMPFVVFAISITFTWLIRKIPLLCKALP